MSKVVRDAGRKPEHVGEFAFGKLEVTTGKMDLPDPDLSFADVMRIRPWKKKHLCVGFNGLIELSFVSKDVAEPNLRFTARMGRRGPIVDRMAYDFPGAA